jgi:hypothetical protein
MVQVSTVGSAFVDDTSLSVTSRYVSANNLSPIENTEAENRHTVDLLTHLAHHWEWLLYSTGGAINMQTSFW